MSAFHVDGRVTLKMEYELAVRLGEYIMKTNPQDKQIAAMGWRLSRLSEEDGESLTEDRAEHKPHDYKPYIPVSREDRIPVQKPPVSNVGVGSLHEKVSVKTGKIRWGY